MEEKHFGYPKYDSNGEMVLTTYDNEYKAMLMDIRVYKMKANEKRRFKREKEEIAVLLLEGKVKFTYGGVSKDANRKDVFTDGPFAVHVCCNKEIVVEALTDTKILVQCTNNLKTFDDEFYRPEDAPWKYSCKGKFGDTAKRRVNTIFDHDISPNSMMVLGEVLNDRGNWSGYLPHSHPQPECYFFKYDRPEGFGASFVGDEVYKAVDESFSAIPGGYLHPQSAAPGFQLYTVWMIRHLDNKYWLQTDRVEDERYTWLHDFNE